MKAVVVKEKKLKVSTKILVGSAIGLAVVAVGVMLFPVRKDISKASVKILAPNKHSGGTGIVLSSSPQESTILTNSHVCGVLENGGFIQTRNNEVYVASSYKKSNKTDLCLVTVDADLHASTTVANREPIRYYEEAKISGHPNLLPNVITKGHFSSNEITRVMVGFEKCTEEERSGDLAFICLFLGGKPIIKTYDATLVTATIMPGSSGSGVYNSDYELSAVVFAGSGNLGYAWTIPYEQVKNFLNQEAPTLDKIELGAFTVNLMESSDGSSYVNNLRSLREICKFHGDKEELKDICLMVETNLVWTN